MNLKNLAIGGTLATVWIAAIGGGMLWFLDNYTIINSESGLYISRNEQKADHEPCFVGLNLDGVLPDCAQL